MTWLSGVVHFSFPFLVHYRIPGDRCLDREGMHWAWGHLKEAWCSRIQQGLDWGQTGSYADTTEAIEHTRAIAVRYAKEPIQIAAAITADTLLPQTDDTVVSMTVAFGAALALLVQGHSLDSD